MKEIIQKDSDHIPDVGKKVTATCMKRGGIRVINFQINDND